MDDEEGACRFIIATLAAIVASQALISAVFQIVYQAITQASSAPFSIAAPLLSSVVSVSCLAYASQACHQCFASAFLIFGKPMLVQVFNALLEYKHQGRICRPCTPWVRARLVCNFTQVMQVSWLCGCVNAKRFET